MGADALSRVEYIAIQEGQPLVANNFKYQWDLDGEEIEQEDEVEAEVEVALQDELPPPALLELDDVHDGVQEDEREEVSMDNTNEQDVVDQGVEQEAHIDNAEHDQVQENIEQIVTDESDGINETESEDENEASIDKYIIEDTCIDAGEPLLEEDRTQGGVEEENGQ